MSTHRSSSSIGQIVGRGVSWSATSNLYVKAINFAAQIALGFLLSQREFGVYAVAISSATVVLTLRDGIFAFLLQRGSEQFDQLKGPIFWLGLAAHTLIAILLFSFGPIAARFYGEVDLRSIFSILAVATVVGTPAAVLKTQLRIELRFRTIALLQVITSSLHYGAVVLLAYHGYGALSFILPLPGIALIEWCVLAAVTDSAPWRAPPRFRTWCSLLVKMKWLIAGYVAMVIFNMGDYAVLGRLVATSTVGIYYFSFQLAANVAMVASTSLAVVLLPALTRVASEPDRLTVATLRTLRALVLIASPLSLGVAAIIDPVETVVWGGRWSAAVVPVQVLCVMMPLRLTWVVGTALLQAQGHFRRWAVLTMVQVVGLLATAAVSGVLDFGATGIAICIAIFFLLAGPAATILATSLPTRSVFAAIGPSWVFAIVAAGIAALCGDIVFSAVPSSFFQATVSGASFIVLFVVLTRCFVPSHLRELIAVLPGRAASAVSRVLFLIR